MGEMLQKIKSGIVSNHRASRPHGLIACTVQLSTVFMRILRTHVAFAQTHEDMCNIFIGESNYTFHTRNRDKMILKSLITESDAA